MTFATAVVIRTSATPGTLHRAGGARQAAVHDVRDESDEDLLTGLAVAGVAEDHRHVVVEVERAADGVDAELLVAVEAVDGDEERGAVLLEVVERREAV